MKTFGVSLAVVLFGGCFFLDAPATQEANNEDPAQSFIAAKDSLQDGDVIAMSNALPDSYHQDLEDLVHTFGDNIDPKPWTETARFVNQLAAIPGE